MKRMNIYEYNEHNRTVCKGCILHIHWDKNIGDEGEVSVS